MPDKLHTKSPVDGSIYVERPYATEQQINNALDAAIKAQAAWKNISITDKKHICRQAVADLLANKEVISEEISWQMGRPLRYTPGEVNGFAERARYMIDIAEQKLADIQLDDKPGFTRFIQRSPLGVVFTIAPWNYPYLTAVNAIIPAIMAGNAVILKPSSQTPLTGERIQQAFASAGLPPGLFQSLILSHDATTKMIQSGRIDYVAFTGSVAGGGVVEKAAAGHYIDVGLELGGKDPAYVCADAELEPTVENLVDGAYFNSGQSCCAIERIYVHQDCYQSFVDRFVSLVQQYRLGNPLSPETTLGPMVRTQAADRVRQQILQALASGAKACIDTQAFTADQQGTPYLAPQVLINVDHSMQVMRAESFGPVVGIMKVSSDQEAIALMNDSEYGLTASIWTQDEKAAITFGNQVQTGTWFMNRCDYLDPALAWTGVKNSGKGCTLSEVGYEKLTRPKSFHLKTSF